MFEWKEEVRRGITYHIAVISGGKTTPPQSIEIYQTGPGRPFEMVYWISNESVYSNFHMVAISWEEAHKEAWVLVHFWLEQKALYWKNIFGSFTKAAYKLGE